jgi:hypothetical protein
MLTNITVRRKRYLEVNLNLEKEIGWWYRSTETSYNSEESNKDEGKDYE